MMVREDATIMNSLKGSVIYKASLLFVSPSFTECMGFLYISLVVVVVIARFLLSSLSSLNGLPKVPCYFVKCTRARTPAKVRTFFCAQVRLTTSIKVKHKEPEFFFGHWHSFFALVLLLLLFRDSSVMCLRLSFFFFLSLLCECI